MHSDHNRYFIELQPPSAAPISRNREAEIRREQAAIFIAEVYSWLQSQDLGEMVSEMDVTAFGQVQITCETEIITRIQENRTLNIATVRPGALYVEGMRQISRRS